MNNADKITVLLNGGAKISYALKEVCGSQKIRIPFDDADFNVPIETLGLSTRSFNALKREGLDTLSATVNHFKTKGWRTIRNFGVTSAAELFATIIDVAWDSMNDAQKLNFLASLNDRTW